MPIRPSASVEIRGLIEALGREDATAREVAIARLAVIGERAVDRLVAAYPLSKSDATRVSILRALEAIADPRTLSLATSALLADADVASAAVAALRPLLASTTASTAAEALDLLVSTALSQQVNRRARLAGVAALRDIPAADRARVADALQADPDPVVRAAVADAGHDDAAARAEWLEALAGRAAEDPALLSTAARSEAASAPLGALQKLIDAARAREREPTDALRAAEWRALRGALHQALARRGSRVALYDLRESIEGSEGPLPDTFAEALKTVGDESCLEAAAAAYARTTDARWRDTLGAALQAIAARENLTVRSATFKRIATRWPEAAAILSTPSRTTPRPKRAART